MQFADESFNFDDSGGEDDSFEDHYDDKEGTSKDHGKNLKKPAYLDEKTMKLFDTTKIEFSHLRIKEFLLQVFCLHPLSSYVKGSNQLPEGQTRHAKD